MTIKHSFLILVWVLVAFCSVAVTTAQEKRPEKQKSERAIEQASDDIIRVDTRVVFTDVLVKDKKTGQPVRDLTRENFQILDDAQPRTVTYFSREGDARARPLALVIALDLWGGKSLSYLKKAAVAEQIITALKALSLEDRVGVMLMWAEEERKGSNLILGKCEMVGALTPDRESTATVLRTVPLRAAQLAAYYNSLPANMPTAPGTVAVPASVAQGGLACASGEISKLATSAKANTQVIAIVLTDDLVPFDSTARKDSRSDLLVSGVTVSGLVMGNRSFADKVFFGVTKPLSSALGLFSVEYFAKETGGEALRVNRPEEFASAIMQLINSLAARYSLGFTLAENEQSSGRLHRLEVRVKARDGRDRDRKLAISARRGYYLPQPQALPPGKK
jgi:VWFA-related protein